MSVRVAKGCLTFNEFRVAIVIFFDCFLQVQRRLRSCAAQSMEHLSRVDPSGRLFGSHSMQRRGYTDEKGSKTQRHRVGKLRRSCQRTSRNTQFGLTYYYERTSISGYPSAVASRGSSQWVRTRAARVGGYKELTMAGMAMRVNEWTSSGGCDGWSVMSEGGRWCFNSGSGQHCLCTASSILARTALFLLVDDEGAAR